jgi:multidrug efflux pump subunit AcrB
LPKLNLSQRQVPIVVKLATDARQDLELLGRLMVPGVKGPVMLSQVASFEMSSGPAMVSRLNRVRNVNFEVELSGVPLGDVTAAVAKFPSIVNLPAGVQQLEIGDAEVQGEMVAGFGMAMMTGILCIYIVLVLLFKDFLHPISILPAVILSFGGAFIGLLVSGKMLSMPSFIGLVMLIGVSTKNSILLVDYAIMARRDFGMNRFDALIDACHKRARPIIMTTIAMVAGMLPLVIGLGSADNSFRSPMAAAVIGGLITSTILSLLVTPSFFSIVDDIEHFVGVVKRKLLRQKEQLQTPPMATPESP